MIRRKRAAAIKDGRAVSPVVATLILILVAVAAAAALYLWLVAWQGGVTGGIGSPNAQYTLTIGGSTSVYPFDQVAVQQFEQNNTNVVVSNNQGGTGAGMLAVCHGAVDIGAASSPQTPEGLQTSDGCPSTAVVTTVAYDAVDVIVPTANAHGLNSISQSTLLAIYVAGGGGTAVFTGVSGYTYSVNGQTAANSPAPGATGFTWSEIPACAQAATTCSGSAFATDTPIVAGTTTPCTTLSNDVCFTAAGSPCGWTVCAGGTVAAPATDVVQTWQRSDISGTTQSFTSRLLGIGASGGTPSGLGFGGCGSDGQLGSCGLAEQKSAAGNPAVISGVAGSPDGIGYASDGLARATGSGVTFLGFQGYGQIAIITPTTGSSGTIAAGILGATTTTGYVGWRPFDLVTTNTPTGEAERFIQYVLDPANNQNFATESAEVSIYSI